MEYNIEIIVIQILLKTIYSSEHKIIIEKLKQARIDVGFDQEDVAKKIGKTQSYISKLESGQRRIDLLCLKELAKIYNKDLSFFITD